MMTCSSCRQFDVFADERAEKTLHISDDGIEVDDFEFEMLFPAEG
jgi:hypothetical protein